MQKNQTLAGVLILITAVLLANVFFGAARSSDLLATWIAGQMFATGQFDEIYVAAQSVFTMQPNESWITFMDREHGYNDAIFPFLYPPIWAWAASFLADVPFDTIEKIATPINAALISGCIFLAHRITRSSISLPVFSLVALVLVYLTLIGTIALFENQPQILVGFLILLTLERLRSDAPVAAGIALAFAAAIKIYPVIFVVFLLARRQYRATTSFAIAGGILGLTSITVAGWPLHAEFLASAASVSRTAIVVHVNYNIHGAIAQFFDADRLIKILSTEPPLDNGIIPFWHVAAKGPVWNLVGLVSSLGMIVLFFFGFRRAEENRCYTVYWPAVLMFVPLITPFGWSYYYISPVVMAPILLSSYRWYIGAGILLGFLFLAGLPMQTIFVSIKAYPAPGQIAGTLAILLLGLAYLAQPKPDRS